jgi:hypothetical protein
MKIKLDFITNSSSASFYIFKKHLSKEQILLIYHHIEISHLFESERTIYNRPFDQWKIIETSDKIKGSTTMDNFSMLWFLDKIGVNEEYIHYQNDNGEVEFDDE